MYTSFLNASDIFLSVNKTHLYILFHFIFFSSQKHIRKKKARIPESAGKMVVTGIELASQKHIPIPESAVDLSKSWE
jgi:hypothetical protein